ncbi:ribonuclease P protein component 4 [Candidatus Methanoprimaticola sp. MG2]|uniref:ribonuclease P protein component 4 n=1 Tax=Candidatus Methanoprimaticola sp. MG2 TaxID=3228838 RepID=UPI0039C6A1B2
MPSPRTRSRARRRTSGTCSCHTRSRDVPDGASAGKNLYNAGIIERLEHTMAKRRISHNAIADIGADRISRLLDMAFVAVREGKVDRARRYIDLALRISAKTKVAVPRDRPYCDGCLTPMIPGLNCRVRVGGHMVRTTCECCGEVFRRPYIREQLHEREGCQKGADEACQRPQPHRESGQGRS